MTAPARLLAVRLHGFKSFAERTVVEFGPGISAVVGPNGSGKSNLADALRWALGEQGRALRSRKSEDVIFAGSERRAALGMADVTIVLDNADGLLPVEYGVLELGRRLYRSGENDYLLNRQRVRLKDLVELLDAAHLADNAFMFIGQGMVDQALALRPEERRPLFEEVAGVRRHERRRRRAEEQLAEAESNLARVEDIVAELRPQARRLSIQAEQQVSRATAGDDLAAALVEAAHARWFQGSTRHRATSARLARDRGEATRALASLTETERAVTALSAMLGARAGQERERRDAYETARATLNTIQLREARLAADLASLGRDRDRLEGERGMAEADLAASRRELATPVPARDADLEAAGREADRELAVAIEELGALRSASQAHGDELAALRRAEAARAADLETARRRVAEAERRAVEEGDRARVAVAERAKLEAQLARDQTALAEAGAAVLNAAASLERSRAASGVADAAARAAAERGSGIAAAAAALRGRVDGLRAAFATEEARGLAVLARRLGGRRVDDGLDIEPSFRPAVELALGALIGAYAVGRSAAAGLAAERGTVAVIDDPEARAVAPASRSEGPVGPSGRVLRERVASLGGGWLVDAVRRDVTGTVRRVLSQVAWVDDLGAVLETQALLPEGWLVVARDGAAVAGPVALTLGRTDAPLERRAELERLEAELAELDTAVLRAGEEAVATERAAAVARVAFDSAGAAEADARALVRVAEAAERTAGRALERVAREAAWHEAQLVRSDSELSRQRDALAALGPIAGHGGQERSNSSVRPAGAIPTGLSGTSPGASPSAQGGQAVEMAALEAWERRVDDLRDRRDRLAGRLAERDRDRRDVDALVARAAAAAAYAEDRLARADTEATATAARDAALVAERLGLAAELAVASARVESAKAVLDGLLAADAGDRERLVAAEDQAGTARDRLRTAEDRLRAAEVADLEARLGLDAIREQVVVELAGIGEVAILALERAAGSAGGGSSPVTADDDTPELETLVWLAEARWADAPLSHDPPTPGRLATLRRRFHELGAANPYAVEEYAALRQRLDALETQGADLRAAIARTRTLIEELSTMIAEQFQTTFRALEAAFDGRFRQLFGGGYARLELTDPSDLSATGVEIVARPPGKKPQALAMLSGGERALTAVALLFAMLEVRPVPFCVLDEVDAALDEANVSRFSEALSSLAERTQFVVITHNRGTIEAADALYGVTVGDDSVSHLVSLRLEEATAIAERVRGGHAVATGPVVGRAG